MESYLKELDEAKKKVKDDITIEIEFRNDILSLENYNPSDYNESDQRQIVERLFFKYIDYICEHPQSSLWNLILNHLYAGDYQCLSLNVKTYLFESLELCSSRHFLPWIDKTLDNDDELSQINIQAFTIYVDNKRKRGLTHGEIRYTILCESSAKLLELIQSKILRDRLVSKQVWLGIFRLKQRLALTSNQKDLFTDWLGIV